MLLSTYGWEATVRLLRTPSDLPNSVQNLPHPAARILKYLRTSNVPCHMHSTPWTKAQILAAVDRGPHPSANQYADFLTNEFEAMCDKGQWMVLPFSSVQDLPNLRISPLGVVPQLERRPRTIVDYTFSGVNQDTVSTAPSESMQFGHALWRLLHQLVYANPKFGPVHLIKVDIADGFYRLHLNPQAIPALGVILPALDPTNSEPLIAFPLTLPMGWVESPPWFCVATETGADLANHQLAQTPHQPLASAGSKQHRLTVLANTVPEPPLLSPITTESLHSTTSPPSRLPQFTSVASLRYVDVYMDDYLMAMQGSPTELQAGRDLLFRTIDSIFQPVQPDDPPSRQEPISVKKLRKGDAYWSTQKRVLGWDLDTTAETLQLPAHRLDRLSKILDDLPSTQRRISVKKWHKVVGELRSMVLAVPGLRGLFSLLQEAFQHKQQKRIRLSRSLHHFLDDMRWLLANLAHRPTRFRELVPTAPVIIGAHDASKLGMGGVFAFTDHDGNPHCFVWRAPFPGDVQANLVSWDQPKGTITNSDLELAGHLMHMDVISQQVDTREFTVASFTDNTPSEAWQKKGSCTTTNAPAYLLRLGALHQRYHRYVDKLHYIPGPDNTMADDASRLWNLSDAELLSHFDTTFPQSTPWQLLPVRPEMLSSVIGALFKLRPDPQCLQGTPPPVTTTGQPGVTIATRSNSLLHSPTSQIPSLSSPYLPCESAQANTVEVAPLSSLTRWLPPYDMWARRWPYWGPKTLV